MYIDKYIPIRNDIPIKNYYILDYNQKENDFHVIIYIINPLKIKIIIRRLDTETGWNEYMNLIIYTINSNLDDNTNIKQIIIIKPSSENFVTLEMDIQRNIHLEPINTNYIQKIPKTIIQTAKSNDITLYKYNSIYSILEQNPEYEYYFFDDVDCRKFIKDNFNQNILDAYDTLIPGAYKADLFRYCYLYINGGIYIDCKKICKVPFRDFIKQNDEVVLVKDLQRTAFYNAFMCMTKDQIGLLNCINDIKYNTLNETLNSVLMISGPQLLYKHFRNYNPILINKKLDNINTYHKTAIVIPGSQKKDIVLLYDYKTYYSENYTSYNKLYKQKKVYFKKVYKYNNYIIYLYPSNDMIHQFEFNIIDNVITAWTQNNQKWNYNLKIKLINDSNNTEHHYDLGYPRNDNTKVTYKFDHEAILNNSNGLYFNLRDDIKIFLILVLLIVFIYFINHITKLK